MTTTTYTPIEVVKTVGMPEEEWHEWRRRGIGGSDVAAIFGCSPFCTKRDLYFTKIGTKPVIEEEENWLAKEYGHALEELVARMFSRVTGLTVIQPEYLYAHPKYRFMQANVDRFVILPDGSTAILECKTCNAEAKFKWDNDGVPYNYELQVRHYMAVMNIDVAYIACLWGNNESCFCYRKIVRDRAFEEDLILIEEEFWNDNVLANTEPPLKEDYDRSLKTIRHYYKPNDKSVPLTETDRIIISDYLALQEEMREYDHKAKELKERMENMLVPVLDRLDGAILGECEYDGLVYSVSLKPVSRTSVPTDKLPWLLEHHEDIYNEIVTTSESRRLTVKAAKPKKAKKTT